MRRGKAVSGGGVSWGVRRKGGGKGEEEGTDAITSHVGIAPVTEPF